MQTPVARIKGFSVLEFSLVTAVIVVLSVLSYPAFVRFFEAQFSRQEQTILNKIERGLELFARENSRLPDQATWAQDLVPFTGLSADEILVNVWERNRNYRVFSVTRDLPMASIEPFYAIVFSHGRDGIISAGTNLLDIKPLAATADLLNFNGTPSTDAAPDLGVFELAELGDEEDGFLLKFTDADEKLAAYQESVRRIQRITKALEVYKLQFYNQALLNGDPTNLPFVPPSDNDGITASQAVRDEMSLYFGNQNATISTDADPGTREPTMRGLMSMLGLPEDYCCNAMDGAPFFYFSNPREVLSAGCGGRNNLFPRVVIQNNADAAANRTCG